jgi:hypothetical protein
MEFNRRGLPRRVVLRFAEVDGRAECVRIEIGTDFDNRHEPDPVPLHTQDLRIPLGRLVVEARHERIENSRTVAEASSILGEPVSERTRQAARRSLAKALAEVKDSGRVRRRAHPDLELARVALAYVSADDPRRPTEAVASAFHLSVSAAGKRVARARTKGLLTHTKQRQAGGRLTAKARALLEEAGDLPKQRRNQQ